MSLHMFPKLIQGSPEWYEARRGIVTASSSSALVTPKTLKPAQNEGVRTLAALLASERITGRVEQTYVGDAMIRGQWDEPVARDIYSEHHAPVTECGLMVYSGDAWAIGYSPDGLVGKNGLIEIKSRIPKIHVQTVLADAAPASAMAQMQFGLLVSGRKWVDYVSYCAGEPLWTKRVLPDPAWHAAFIDALDQIYQDIAHMEATYRARVKGLPPTEYIPYQNAPEDIIL